LRESEERFRGVFEFAPVGMFVAGPDTRLLQVNAAFCSMLGYSEQELLAKTWPELLHPEDVAYALQHRENLWKDRQGRAHAEGRLVHRSGTAVWTQLRISVLRGADGRAICAVVHAEDITERRRAAATLRESEERFRRVFEQAPVGIFLASIEGKFIRCNARFAEILGYPAEELPGMTIRQVTHPEDIQGSAELLQRLANGAGYQSGMEKRYLRKDGSFT